MTNNLSITVDSAILAMLESFNTPRSLAVWLLYRSGEHSQLLQLQCHTSSSTFVSDYVVTGLLKKAKFLRTGIDTRRTALESFAESEQICARYNRGEFETERSRTVIRHAREKIRSLLKGISPYSFLDHCGFGPGSDLSTEGVKTSFYNKLSTNGSVTREASIFLEFMKATSLLGRYGRAFGEDEDYTHDERASGNRLSIVPKNAKTDRVIAVEPRWNIFFQKGVGQVLRRALRRANIHLESQPETNRKLARIGSIDGSYATIDLKSASDSIPLMLVKELLPPEWFEVLDRLRSHYTNIDGIDSFNEKFSSMGNGFTFELETLIFYAVTSRHDVGASVFGDDIVCLANASRDTILDLESLSFRVNREKTFIDGPFRESCGHDYLNGRLITPLYIKRISNEQELLQLANGFSALASRLGGDLVRDYRLSRAWRCCLPVLLKAGFTYGPIELSGSIHHDVVKRITPSGRRSGWDGHIFNTQVFRARLFRFVRMGPALLAQLLSPSNEDGYSVRDLGIYVTRRVFLSRGYLLPPYWELPPRH